MVNPFPWVGRSHAVSERSGDSGRSIKTFKIEFPTEEIPFRRLASVTATELVADGVWEMDRSRSDSASTRRHRGRSQGADDAVANDR